MMKCVAANGRIGSVNKGNAITRNEPGDALGKFRYRNVSAVPTTDPQERIVGYAETGQNGVAEIAPSWSPSVYRRDDHMSENAHRVEVTDAGFRADDRLGVITAPPGFSSWRSAVADAVAAVAGGPRYRREEPSTIYSFAASRRA